MTNERHLFLVGLKDNVVSPKKTSTKRASKKAVERLGKGGGG